jgi:hypothetical protein
MGSNPQTLWKPPSHLYTLVDRKYCTVWVFKTDKTERMEEYHMRVSSPSELVNYKNMFAVRLEQVLFPIGLHFIIDSSTNFCGSETNGSILLERIPYRLCQFCDIPKADALSLMWHCLKGYQELHSWNGLFNVQSTMIGFDRFFRPKVWHHTDLSSPTPQDPFCQSVPDMINSIVNSVERVAEFTRQGTFSDYWKLNSNNKIAGYSNFDSII